ncbi:DUF2924 domain-containing protein [Ferrovibrio sp.]|uniref:DUF2924 domain-containing protein n=1 Tax=Ferrovibrio sp. TaxID=1917215 RepID=UPI003D09A1E8
MIESATRVRVKYRVKSGPGSGPHGPSHQAASAPAPPSIDALEQLPTSELKRLWSQHWKQGGLPKRVSRELLVLGLAHDQQARTLGGLSKEARRRLESVMAGLERTGKVDIEVPIRIKPGTRLVREWQGERHEVTVLEKRFAYRGRQFDSLSEVAREITGTRWSGPVFFGLKKVSRSRRDKDSDVGVANA